MITAKEEGVSKDYESHPSCTFTFSNILFASTSMILSVLLTLSSIVSFGIRDPSRLYGWCEYPGILARTQRDHLRP